MSKPSVSVVVTTHFRDEMLAECLDSLAAQTLPLHEVVVVDDGGNGTARAVVEHYGPAFKYIWQPNAGQQSARNHGVRMSIGEWIAFLDDDDLWLPNRHEHIVALAATGQVDLIAGDFTKFGDSWTASTGVFDEIAELQPDLWDNIPRAPNANHTIVGSFPTTRLLPTSPFWGGTLVAQRDFFNHIGGWNEGLRGIKSEDAEFAFRAIKHARLGVIWPSTLLYRSHPGNDSNSSLLNAIGRTQVWENILKNMKLSQSEISCLTREIKNTQHKIIWMAYKKKDSSILKKTFKKMSIFEIDFSEYIKIMFSKFF